MICVIPARSGSQRIPNKNFKEFYGKPIIEHSIDLARESGLFERVYVSIDCEMAKKFIDDRYKIESQYYFVFPHWREEKNSKNEVGTQQVTAEVVRRTAFCADSDYYCCLYATAPLLSFEDLARGYVALKNNPTMQYAFSVGTEPLRDAGNFYWGRREAFLADIPVHAEHSIMVPLPEERVCDINTMDDWIEAEEKYRKLYGAI